MSGANHSGVGEGVKRRAHFPFPLRPGTFASPQCPQTFALAGSLVQSGSPAYLGCGAQLGRSLRGSSRGAWASRAVLGAAIPRLTGSELSASSRPALEERDSPSNSWACGFTCSGPAAGSCANVVLPEPRWAGLESAERRSGRSQPLWSPAASFLLGSLSSHFSSLLRQKPSGNVTAMPVDTLTPGARDTPALPIRLRTKVPGYLLRRPADGGARKPSAVERLEADKAKYVKSLHVANTRQEPVQPLLCKQPLFSPGTRRTVLTPSRRALPGPGRRPQLDLDILSSLINLCDSPVSPAEASRTPGRAEGARQTPPATPPRPPPSIAAVRRVDVLPLPASPVQPCPSPGPAAASSPVRPPGLQRSKSDLSERFSRAAADLERFFNFCGLDPEEARGLGVAHLARASSDIVSLAGPSAGPASSEGGCSRRSSVTIEERARERVPYGVSVIERNARVIKWLYGLRQARETPAAEG